jgi:hypothetical protein
LKLIILFLQAPPLTQLEKMQQAEANCAAANGDGGGGGGGGGGVSSYATDGAAANEGQNNAAGAYAASAAVDAEMGRWCKCSCDVSFVQHTHQ